VVPETLMHALTELEDHYRCALADPEFLGLLRTISSTMSVARRPSISRAAHAASRRRADLPQARGPESTPARHQINNCIGQALLTRRMGKPRIIAETGAGQHGVATATAAALFGLKCQVYMGEEDVRRQRLNVFKMHALG